jgi:hypothetical protein
VRRADAAFCWVMLSLVLPIMPAGSARADAVRLPCESHRLSRPDQAAARAAITKAAGSHEILWSTQTSCSWRNRKSKHRTTRVDLRDETSTDGSILRRSLHCHDHLPEWRCEEYSGREFATKLVLDGVERRIRLSLPTDFDSRAVNDLLTRALTLAPRQSAAENCAANQGVPDGREQELLPLFKKSFDLEGDDWYMAIREWTGSVEIHAGDFYMGFSRSSGTPDRFEFRCWDIYEPIGTF